MPMPRRNARARLMGAGADNLWDVVRNERAIVELVRDGRSAIMEFDIRGGLQFCVLFPERGTNGIQVLEDDAHRFLATEKGDPDMPVGVYSIKAPSGAEHGITQAAHHTEQDPDGFRTVKAWCGKTVTGMTKWTHKHDTVTCAKCKRSQ